MEIERSVRKQKRSQTVFIVLMIILFFMLPIIVFFTGETNIFFLVALIVIELLIVLGVIASLNNGSLQYTCSNNRLKVKSGIFPSQNLILCDKVVLVHTEHKEEDIEIVIITIVKVRNKYMKPVIEKAFFKRYPEVQSYYNKVKKITPKNFYYYTSIKKGGFKKYKLLDTIYVNCVKAIYTDEAIGNVKIARAQKKI